jgi:hypothetical protein
MNKITSTIYLFFLMLLCLGLSPNSFAQASGDFRSTATGNWNSAATWQRYNGTTWDASGVGANNPGLTPTATSSVWIQTAHVVTLTANESCNDLHIATGTSGISATLLGKIGLSTFTLSINGKMRDYFGTLNTIPGTNTTNGYSIYPFTGTTGKVSIVGTTRIVFNSGEWGASISTPSTGIFPLEINLADNTQVVTFGTNTKSTSFNLVTGIVSGATVSMDNGTTGQGNATIGSGTTLISSGGTVFQRTGSTRAGILTIDGSLKLSGQTPVFAMNSLSNTGTVEYSRSGVQTFISVISSGVAMTYQNLVLSGSGAKTFTGNLTVGNDLTLNAGATFTVPSGSNATIGNKVINNGVSTDFVIQNNANLIQVNNTLNTGAITLNRNSSPLLRLDYTLWSSPVAGQNLAAFSPLTSLAPSRFYTFDTTFNTGGVNGAYAAITDPTIATFSAGAGYLIRMPNTADAGIPTAYLGQFTGIANNGDVPVSLIDGAATGLRFNLVGNPYPSTLKMQNFVFDNTANIENTLWFWRKTNGAGTAYCTWQAGLLVTDPGTFVTNGNTQSVNPLGIIQTAQGFFVEAKSGASSLTFKNSQRVANTVGQFFKTKQVAASSKIWLNATNVAGDFSQMAVTYFDGATQGVDTFDGKYINDSAFALTSNINNEEYTIQGRPAFDVADVVALNFKTELAGDYTIAIDHSEGVFASGQDIYLVDSKTGTETNLKTSSYNFTAASGVDNTRFSLKYQKTLNVDDAIFSENNVMVYAKNGSLYVNSGEMAMNTIQVYDVQGRLIAERKNVKATTATLDNLKANNQVLLVKVSGENNQVVTKKVAN